MFSSGNKVRALTEEVEAIRKELAPLKVGQERLQRELGISKADEIIALIRDLEGKVAASAPAPVEEDTENPLAGLTDPKQVLLRIRTFTTKIESLNGTVSSMEEQLVSLYEDKERLEREIGASEVDDVLEAFRHLQNVIGSMESQLMTMYASREHMEVELGTSDPRQIVATIKNVAKLTHSIRQELGEELFDNLGLGANPSETTEEFSANGRGGGLIYAK